MVERPLRMREAGGSIPSTSILFTYRIPYVLPRFGFLFTLEMGQSRSISYCTVEVYVLTPKSSVR
jgi:hypothetical protein